MGGSSGGGGSNEAARVQASLAQQLFQETDPLRRNLIGRSQNFLSTGVDNSPLFDSFKAQADPQFARARENIISDTPSGGALIDALAGLEGNKASTYAQARGGIEEAELARAMGLATGQTGTAISGLGQSASVQAALAQSNAQREAGIFGALGTGAGAYFGSK